MANLWMEADRYQIKGVPDRVKMNQLNNLLHDALIATEHVEKCAILDRKEKEQRAGSPGFLISKEQIVALQDAFKKCSIIRKEGICFEEKNYKCTRADKNSIYAKGLQSNEGLIATQTASLLIVASYTEKMFPSVCVEAVEKLTDYFREKGR
uniref:Profilin n=1 Tax=Ciona savignyi TaxID=51511 RepID=H2ZKQ4_CIOSA